MKVVRPAVVSAQPFKYMVSQKQLFRSRVVLGHEYHNEMLSIHPDGRIEIHANPEKPYLWDGCSPKFRPLGLFMVGTPDGVIDAQSGRSTTQEASMFHDILYQYLGKHPLSRKECDLVFKELLGNFRWAKAYYHILRIFGGIYYRLKVA